METVLFFLLCEGFDAEFKVDGSRVEIRIADLEEGSIIVTGVGESIEGAMTNAFVKLLKKCKKITIH